MEELIYDQEQLSAITDESKQQLLIAGAGAGKTTVLSAKVKYLVEEKNVKPEEILMISFTNQATNELIDRINNQMNINCHIKTFHKFGLELQDTNKTICTDPIKIIKKISTNKTIKKLYTEYYNLKLLKKIEFIYNPIHKIPTNNQEEFFNFIKTLIDKNKNLEFINTNSKKLKSQVDIITDLYQSILNKKDMIDFSDMIINALKTIQEEDTFDYKYIFIDEYQDISYIRHLLIKSIVDKYNPTLVAVGDDWQSIYAFSGSRIDLFTDFKKLYPNAKIMKLTHTYRNSQELIDIIGTFVMKNDKQIKKNLISNKHIDTPIIFIEYKKSNKIDKLCQSIDYLIKNYPDKSILILGRYKFDINKFLDNKRIKQVNNKIIYKDYQIDYMTVHASKGLGYDNIILINCENQEFGFPSNKKNNKILDKLLTTNDQLNEERRLFYVALTRTKNKVILLIPKKNPSPFIEEIKQ